MKRLAMAFPVNNRSRPDITAPQPEMRDWGGIRAEALPPARFLWDMLLKQAGESWFSRKSRYPRMIEAGEIEEDKAAAEIAIWRAIRDDWLWIITEEENPIPKWMIPDAIAAIRGSIRTAAQIGLELQSSQSAAIALREIGPMAEALIGLLWHYEQQRDGGMDVHFCARINHDRARATGRTVDQRRAFWGLPERKRKPETSEQDLAA